MRADRLHGPLEVPFDHNHCDSPLLCFEGLFKLDQPAFATTLLNGAQKSKKSEIRYNELGVTQRAKGIR
jgi:hypothetical protein